MPLYARTILFTGPADEVDAALRGHEEHVSRLEADGKLRIAATFKLGDGCLDIFEAEDLHEAENIARSSPLVEDGLGSWMLREMTEREA